MLYRKNQLLEVVNQFAGSPARLDALGIPYGDHLKGQTYISGFIVQNEGKPKDRWFIDSKTFEATYEEVFPAFVPFVPASEGKKTLNTFEVNQARKVIKDIEVYGDGDTFALLCKASSKSEGWMKSTKVCNVAGGAIVQVTTQQGDNVAEALTFVPGVMIDVTQDPRRLVPIVHYDGRIHDVGDTHE